MKQKGVGFIGCGAMGSAFIKGIIKGNKVPAAEVLVYDIRKEAVKQVLDEFPVVAAGTPRQLLEESRIVFGAVKPADYPSMLSGIKDFLRKEHLLVSVAAGITAEYIKTLLGQEVKVARLMPNTPCLIGEGAVALAADENVNAEELQEIKGLIEVLGEVVEVKEKDMDAVTGLSGSGPAYVYLFLESLIEGGVKAGLERKVASRLAVQTVMGAAKMMRDTGNHPAVLKARVTSPGGTTSAGLYELEERAFRSAVISAVTRACQRAGELGLPDQKE